MTRTLRTTLSSLVLSAAFVAPFVAASGASAADAKCTIATKGEADGEVGKACASGGIREAKKVMKEMTKAAKAKGMKVDCDSCHKDDTKFELTDNAKADYKKMLELIGKK